jgi:alpha-glucosidase
MQPLTQSTEEVPQGPLTLRIYPGPNCGGELYQDDGTTLDYQKGNYLRAKFSCEATPAGIRVHLGAYEGRYRPWWTQYEVQVVGWTASTAQVALNGKSDGVRSSVANQRLIITIPASGTAAELQIKP